METNNETVELVCDKNLRHILNEFGMPVRIFNDIADEIVAAHKREIGELKGERKGLLKANESLAADNDRLRDELKKKDAEIAQLVSVINSECNKCGDCAKFGYDCNAGDIDGNENCRACKKFVSKEVSALRALVKELADALEKIDDMADGDMCKYFDGTQHCSKCKYINCCETGVAHNALKTHESEISKAREMFEKERGER